MENRIDSDYYYALKDNELLIVNFKNKIFDFLTNLDESQHLMNYLKEAEYDNEIKALVLMNDEKALGEEVYDEFMKSIVKEMPGDGTADDVTTFIERNTRFREINILNKFIKYLAGYQKLVIAGIKGTIVTPFIGVLLSSDIRFAAQDATFSFSHIKYGLHPSGGLPFLLSHFLHRSKALEVQFTEKMDILEAYNLGLVTKVLPLDNFNELCLNEVRKYTAINSCTLRFTKRLTNYSMRMLKNYFEYEASLLNL